MDGTLCLNTSKNTSWEAHPPPVKKKKTRKICAVTASLELLPNQQVYRTVRAPPAREVQVIMNNRWRSRVEELTRWRNARCRPRR